MCQNLARICQNFGWLHRSKSTPGLSCMPLSARLPVHHRLLHSALSSSCSTRLLMPQLHLLPAPSCSLSSSCRARTAVKQAIPMSALRAKTGKIGNKRKSGPGLDAWSVVGYSSAEGIDLLGLQEALGQHQFYRQMPLSEDLEAECVYITNTGEQEQVKEIFIFREGCVVFWNVPELERHSVLNFMKPFHEDGYEEEVVFEESEMMAFSLSKTGKSHLEKGVINVEEDSSALVKYTFSDAISLSVKLGVWESSLVNIIDSMEHISEDLKSRAAVKLSHGEVLQKTGEILALRHLINLSSDLLDTPDFYWDREPLEDLFLATCAHLAVKKRTQVVNEKLSHCLELIQMINNHLDTKQGHRLEWIIIVLIAIEIIFECLHFVERKFGALSFLEPREPRGSSDLAAQDELLAEGAAPQSQS